MATVLSQVQRLLATPGGLAAAQAAAAGSTDPDVLNLIANYQAANCANMPGPGPVPASLPAGTYWFYEPSGRPECAYSTASAVQTEPPPPIPQYIPPTPPAQNIVSAAPVPVTPVAIAPGQPVIASMPGASELAWLTEPSTLSPTVPNYWIVAGAAILGLLLFSRRR